MDVLIVSPPTRVNNGNQVTAEEWAAALGRLGHDVRIRHTLDDRPADLLIAIHAEKSHAAVREFRETCPKSALVVALSGTDLYPALSPVSLASLDLADHVIVLQEKALDRLPASSREKANVVRLSAPALSVQGKPREENTDRFQVCVVGHMRQVKDPLRAASASRLLPPESRVIIRHAGAILDEEFAPLVREEQQDNARYQWLGELPAADAHALIASSDLFVLTSISEGGSRVLSEAVTAGTPVLATRNDASISLLGEDYAGLFAPGDTQALASLMLRCETEPGFLAELASTGAHEAARCSESCELETWRNLLAKLFSTDVHQRRTPPRAGQH